MVLPKQIGCTQSHKIFRPRGRCYQMSELPRPPLNLSFKLEVGFQPNQIHRIYVFLLGRVIAPTGAGVLAPRDAAVPAGQKEKRAWDTGWSISHAIPPLEKFPIVSRISSNTRIDPVRPIWRRVRSGPFRQGIPLPVRTLAKPVKARFPVVPTVVLRDRLSDRLGDGVLSSF